MDYIYSLDNSAEGETAGATKKTEFYNPASLRNNHFLHAWLIFSTSPFENGAVFTTTQPAISSITLTPASATLPAGISLQMSATVVTTGFANKAVTYSVGSSDPATIDAVTGLLKIDADASENDTITVTATSVFDTTKTGTATITVSGSVVPVTTTEETTTEETTT